jgi:heterotetrameric sarcosine oxidase delta subunit
VIELPCPWCGPRDASEFRYSGEATPRPDPTTATPDDWREYLYLRRNPRGWVRETWFHRAGCRRYFRLERDTGSDRIRTGDRQP